MFATEAIGRLPPCPSCGAQTDDSFLGQIDALIICDCAECGDRFLVEEVPVNAEEIARRKKAVPIKFRKAVPA